MKAFLIGSAMAAQVLCPVAAADWFHRSPEGAQTYAVAAAGPQLLLGTRRGLYVSGDGGANWVRLPSLSPGTHVRDIAVDAQDAAHWYAVVIQPAGTLAVETRDAGQSWVRLLDHGGFNDFPTLHPLASRAMVRDSTAYFWWATSDAGLNWSRFTTTNEHVTGLVGLGLPGNPFGGLFSGGAGQQFRISSSDLTSWNAPLLTMVNEPAGVGIGNLEPRQLHLTQAFWRGIYNPIPGNYPTNYPGIIDFAAGMITRLPAIAGGVFGMIDDPTAPDTVLALVKPNAGFCDACVSLELWSWTPGASQWQRRSGELPYKFGFLDASLHAAGGYVWVTDNTGLRASADGGLTFQSRLGGVRESRANDVLVDPRDGDSLLAARPMRSLQRSSDAGVTWADVGGQIPQDVRALARSPVSPDHLVATARDGLYRSADAGATWQRVPTAIDPAPGTRGWNELVWCANDDGSLLATIGDKPYRSQDGGMTWTANPDHGLSGITSLQSATASPRLTYVHKVSSQGGAFVSGDCGLTLTPMEGADRVAVNPGNSLHIVGWQYSTRRFRYSHDGGQTWAVSGQPALQSDNAPIGWIDACRPARFTGRRLVTTIGAEAGSFQEAAALEDSDDTLLNTVDSQCVNGVTVTLIGTQAGLWWYRDSGGETIFADGFQTAD